MKMGITDTDNCCNLCFNHLTDCELCQSEPEQKVIPIPDWIRERQKEQSEKLDADIRYARWKRGVVSTL